MVKLAQYEVDYHYDHLEYNECPSIEELENVIKIKKNSKSTTDFPNEMLKKGGRGFFRMVIPNCQTFLGKGSGNQNLEQWHNHVYLQRKR